MYFEVSYQDSNFVYVLNMYIVHIVINLLANYIWKRLEILRLCSKAACKCIYSYNSLNIKCNETSCYTRDNLMNWV